MKTSPFNVYVLSDHWAIHYLTKNRQGLLEACEPMKGAKFENLASLGKDVETFIRYSAPNTQEVLSTSDWSKRILGILSAKSITFFRDNVIYISFEWMDSQLRARRLWHVSRGGFAAIGDKNTYWSSECAESISAAIDLCINEQRI